MPKMNTLEFHALISAHRISGRTLKACRLVLVDGLSANRAAQEVGIQASAVSRALKRLRKPLCDTCGQVLGKKSQPKDT